MFYINSLLETFSISLTLGDEDTNDPPNLALGFTRKGTNETVSEVVNMLNVTKGNRYITIADLETSIFDGTGQYDYVVYDITTPETPIEIEQGICIVTGTPITKTTYGTDKERGENKAS